MKSLKPLTDRQRQVAILLSEGYCVKEIAVLIGCSPKTIEYHRARIFAVLKTNSIALVTRYCVRQGWLRP